MNLIERLRTDVKWEQCRAHPMTECPAAGLLEDAAAEIERLEGALKRLYDASGTYARYCTPNMLVPETGAARSAAFEARRDTAALLGLPFGIAALRGEEKP